MPDVLWATYKEDVDAIAHRLPAKARDYVLAPWHCNPNDHRCLHDSWIEEVHIEEPSSGSRHERREIRISIRFFGAYHDRFLILHFSDVRRYSLGRPLTPDKRQNLVGHGDALEDSIAVCDDGYLIYSLRLEFGHIEIECKDLEFSEELI